MPRFDVQMLLCGCTSDLDEDGKVVTRCFRVLTLGFAHLTSLGCWVGCYRFLLSIRGGDVELNLGWRKRVKREGEGLKEGVEMV